MTSKKGLIRRSHLYIILDKSELKGRSIEKVAAQALSGGADIIQLRDKGADTKEMAVTATRLKRIAGRFGIPLIINDRLEVAVASGADGLHIGQGDIGVSLARKVLGPNKLIGISARNAKEALRAKKEGAEYIGIGPIFRTPIKNDTRPRGLYALDKVKSFGLPAFAIGGIDLKRASQLSRKGFNKIAVIRAVCSAKNARTAAIGLKKAING